MGVVVAGGWWLAWRLRNMKHFLTTVDVTWLSPSIEIHGLIVQHGGFVQHRHGVSSDESRANADPIADDHWPHPRVGVMKSS